MYIHIFILYKLFYIFMSHTYVYISYILSLYFLYFLKIFKPQIRYEIDSTFNTLFYIMFQIHQNIILTHRTLF